MRNSDRVQSIVAGFPNRGLSSNHAAFNAAKDARRLQREAEIRALGFKPAEGKKNPPAAVKYRGLRDPTKT